MKNRLVNQNWLPVAIVSLLIAGCQSLGMGVDHRTISAANDLPKPVPRTWPVQSQDVLTQRAAVPYGLIRSPDLEKYLNGLYTKIKSKAGVPDWQGKVYLVANSNLHAYATSGGNIYISPSWISTVSSEDELVAILCHEFGHIYMHYHELEKVTLAANQAADWAALGSQLVASNIKSLNGWPVGDFVMATYQSSRDIASAHYTSGQEMSADKFALNLSLKMGYSYEGGVKAYLEHTASWEDEREAQQKELENKLSESFGGLFTLASIKAKNGWSFLTRDHPATIERLDEISKEADNVPAKLMAKKPTTKPLIGARSSAETAVMLKSFSYAIKALADPLAPNAYDYAKKSGTGLSQRHAYSAIAIYKTQLAGVLNGTLKDSSNILRGLDANINSEPDRAWVTYLEKANFLARTGSLVKAKATMDDGFAYFNNAGDVWPEAILFYGQYESWDKAKQLASACSDKYPALASACKTAARTPAEKAEMDRRAQENAKKLTDKLFKKNS